MAAGPTSDGDALLLLLDDRGAATAWAQRLRDLRIAVPGLRVLAAPRSALAAAERLGRELGPCTPDDALRVDEDGRWIDSPRGRVDLTRKRAARNILRRLVALRLRRPGEILTLAAVFAVGWPGERVREGSLAGRVYTAVWALRTAGLGAALLRTPDGYLLDPSADLAVMRDGAAIDLNVSPRSGRGETEASDD